MKLTILITIATALIASIVAVEARSLFNDRIRADDEQSTGGWEYLVVQGGTTNLTPSDSGSMRKADGAFSREYFPLEKNLDKLGAKGWELVTVSGSPNDPIYYLKRRK
ncbi:MAG: hypothetical protein DMF60_18700 [Acidobacteria bacterium]|nr:MAG: hypothetical protein DMF60_18700 [Acidobacteriota bacterium]